jgi:hypothetical protein
MTSKQFNQVSFDFINDLLSSRIKLNDCNCIICGRKLKNLKSINTGMGKTCYRKNKMEVV